MKVCARCGEEFGGKDGDNVCEKCERKPFRKVRISRREREAIYRELGLVKVKGALAGVYWE